jgi:hypothetical protein
MSGRAAFTIIVEREDGRRIVENTIIDHRDGPAPPRR